jgi:hypothetical protein
MNEAPKISGITQEEIDAARRMPPAEKLVAGLRMFDEECRLLREEIRQKFPELSAEEVEHVLGERLDVIHDRAGREYGLRLGLIP